MAALRRLRQLRPLPGPEQMPLPFFRQTCGVNHKLTALSLELLPHQEVKRMLHVLIANLINNRIVRGYLVKASDIQTYRFLLMATLASSTELTGSSSETSAQQAACGTENKCLPASISSTIRPRTPLIKRGECQHSRRATTSLIAAATNNPSGTPRIS